MMKIFIFSLLVLSVLVSLSEGRIWCGKRRPCLNGGFCNRTRRCDCPNTFYGERCEYSNECYEQCPDNRPCIRVPGNGTKCGKIKCTPIADIAIVLDCSGSISKKKFGIMLKTVENFVANFKFGPKDIQVAVIAFNDFLSPRKIQLNSFKNRKDFLKELKKYAREHTGGGTRTDLALKELRTNVFTKKNGDRPQAPDVALVLTDGKSNKKDLTIIEARKLKKTDINVISIGIGRRIDKGELEEIATKKENVFITKFSLLLGLVKTLVNKTCEVTSNICDKKPCKNGGQCRLFQTEYICDCPPGYSGLNCEIKCDTTGDVVIMLDESGSISKENFNKVIDSVMYLIKHLDIANGKTRVGLITYAYRVFNHYDLDAFDNKLDLLFVTDLLRYMYKGGPTLTHKALRYLRKYSFTLQRGDRPRFPNYAIVYSDGKSRYPWLTRRNARALQRSGVTVYSMGVGYRVDKREVYAIASKPKRHHVHFTSFYKLPQSVMEAVAQVCYDLRPIKACLKCKQTCDCPSGMKCCRGCCRDTVTLLVCPSCYGKMRCATSKTCPKNRPVCWRGCCRTSKYVKRERCQKCKKNCQCRYGWKCCRGCCRKPKVVVLGCLRSKVCSRYPEYMKCGKSKECCRSCDNRDA